MKKMKFCLNVIQTKQTTQNDFLFLTNQKDAQNYISVEFQLFNDAMIDAEINEIKMSLQTSNGIEIPLKISGISYSLLNYDGENQTIITNQFLLENSTFVFRSRSYLNLTLSLLKVLFKH